jgi:hypothetical protein
MKKGLTDKQVKFAEMYARRARLSVETLIERLETGMVTFKELQQGIL